ncbi:hypothetical protein CF319_g4083 [Tilletia indica]|nr:hypothetical protein CF327_g5704 [Tilletia walkeri]KAE8222780.1 hypothetical protein CF319_g4083 [Tilletia indica]KAE8233492.1 hypothetical protein CF326_g1469 [Tilletia indica]
MKLVTLLILSIAVFGTAALADKNTDFCKNYILRHNFATPKDTFHACMACARCIDRGLTPNPAVNPATCQSNCVQRIGEQAPGVQAACQDYCSCYLAPCPQRDLP